MYAIIYHLHPLIAIISVTIFNYKFWNLYTQPDYHISHHSRLLSRVTDSLLLLTGVLLAIYRGRGILSATWFDYKLIMIMVYIILGVFATKAPKGGIRSLVFYILSMLAVATIIFLVKIKPF